MDLMSYTGSQTPQFRQLLLLGVFDLLGQIPNRLHNQGLFSALKGAVHRRRIDLHIQWITPEVFVTVDRLDRPLVFYHLVHRTGDQGRRTGFVAVVHDVITRLPHAVAAAQAELFGGEASNPLSVHGQARRPCRRDDMVAFLGLHNAGQRAGGIGSRSGRACGAGFQKT